MWDRRTGFRGGEVLVGGIGVWKFLLCSQAVTVSKLGFFLG